MTDGWRAGADRFGEPDAVRAPPRREPAWQRPPEPITKEALEFHTRVILFHLFGGKTPRFSDLERAIRGTSQKMLAQQLRQLERDLIVTRVVHSSVPPKIAYHLTEWDSLSAALYWLLTWAEHQPALRQAVGGV